MNGSGSALVIALLSSVLITVSCAQPQPPATAGAGAAVMASTTGVSDRAGDPLVSRPQILPPQYRAGLRAEAALRTAQSPWERGHTLDLRLTNTEDDAKRFLSVEKVVLGHELTHFRRPPLATLRRRGSSMDYPGIAGWDVGEPSLRVLRPLVVMVRYEGSRGVVVASFQWDVWLESPARYPGAPIAPPE
jgi:hypothetical protein